MGGEGGQNSNGSTGAIGRRRLLQGAAAAGVGVAVWSTPTISAIGGTPAYALVCTSGKTSYELGTRNTNCNCDSLTSGPKSVRYKELGSACGGTPVFPGTAVMVQGGCGGPAITDSGTCPEGYGTSSGDIGNAGVCVTPNNSQLFCQAEVRVYQSGACGPGFTRYTGPIGQGSTFLKLPGVPCQAGGNIFMSVLVTCSVEEECLS